MKRVYETPVMMVERFELDQHVAAACLNPISIEEKQIFGCKHETHQDGLHGHTWDVSAYNLFTSALESCTTKINNDSDAVAFAKAHKDELGSDVSSWGGQHGPMLNGYDISTVYTSY